MLGQRQLWAEAVVFTAAFFTWTRLPGSPFDDFWPPSFGALSWGSALHDERATPPTTPPTTAPRRPQTIRPDRIVCWSSDEMPMLLPCDHPVCRDCLVELRGHEQPYCPLCRRLVLFRINDSYQAAVHETVPSIYAADSAANLVLIILLLWQQLYWNLFLCVGNLALHHLVFPRIMQLNAAAYGVRWWRLGVFRYLLVWPVPNWRFLDSVWVAGVLALVFADSSRVGLGRIGELDVVVLV